MHANFLHRLDHDATCLCNYSLFVVSQQGCELREHRDPSVLFAMAPTVPGICLAHAERVEAQNSHPHNNDYKITCITREKGKICCHYSLQNHEDFPQNEFN